MRAGVPSSLQREVVGAEGEAERGAVERFAGAGVEAGARVGRRGLRVGRLEAEGAGGVDGADERLEEVEGAGRLEAVRMGRDAAHGVDGDGAGGEALWVSPRKSVQGWSTVKGRSKAAWAISAARARMRAAGEAGAFGHGFGGVVVREVAVEDVVEDGAVAVPCAGEVGADAGGVEGDGLAGACGRGRGVCRWRP